MKHLTLIIHTDVQQDMPDQLRNLEQVSGFTFSHAEDGVEVESDPFLSAQGRGKQASCSWRTTFNVRFYENFKLLND